MISNFGNIDELMGTIRGGQCVPVGWHTEGQKLSGYVYNQSFLFDFIEGDKNS